MASKWMELLPEQLTKMKLFNLAIPGSHDSFTVSLDKHLGFTDETPKVVQFLAKCCCCCFSGKVLAWSVTQRMTMLDQLNSGIRYLDLRVYKMDGEDEYRFGHGIYGEEVKVGLEKIKPFFGENKKEVVILDFNHFYPSDPTAFNGLRDQICEIFGDLLIPNGDLSTLTLAEIWEKPGRIILNETGKMKDPKFWTSIVDSPWPNTSNVDTLMRFLDSQVRPTDDRFYVRQGVLTGVVYDVLFYSNQKTFSAAATQRFVSWLQGKAPGPGGINICIVNFVEKFDYINQVIKLNDKLLG